MNVRRTLATLGATLALVALGAGTAQAGGTEAPTKRDRGTVRDANGYCDALNAEYGNAHRQWVGCVVGTFQWERSRVKYVKGQERYVSARVITDDRVTADGGSVVLEGRSRYTNLRKVRKVSKADRAALAEANAVCLSLPRDTALWEACTVGTFTLIRDRAISANDYVVTRTDAGDYVLTLVHGSHYIRPGK